jgi:hypothetical protein
MIHVSILVWIPRRDAAWDEGVLVSIRDDSLRSLGHAEVWVVDWEARSGWRCPLIPGVEVMVLA